MREIVIDCIGIHSPREFHRILAEKLSFDAGYGGNLDALYDCLLELPEPTRLRFVGFEKMPGTFQLGFRKVLENAVEDTTNFCVSFL